MALGDGLLIGIDIQNSSSQVSFYNIEEKSCESVETAEGCAFYSNPTDIRELLFDVSEDAAAEYTEQYVVFISEILENAKKAAGRMKIEKICVAVETFEKPVLDMIKNVFNKLMMQREQWCVISHVESYVYYAYSQNNELYKNGVMLLDYKKDGLHTHQVKCKRYESTDYIIGESNIFTEEDIRAVVNGTKTLADVEETLLSDIRSVMADRTLSSVYLTGEGFDVKAFPKELAKMLCAGRKAFFGQNLFVKGACYCAYEEVNHDIFDNIVIICDNTLASGMELEITDHGELKRFRVVKPGVNWYMAERDMDFILDDIRKLTFYIKKYPNGEEYTEDVDISEIPYRDSRMTRIGTSIRFTENDKCVVTVKDKGFGSVVKSSGKVIKREVSL